MGTGLKNPTLGGPTRTPKKLYAHKMGEGDRLYYPRAILGTFWRFGGFPMKTVCQTGLPEDAIQQRKRYTTRQGVISEALQRVYLGSRHAGSAKYTLWRTSEMTHQG